MENYVLRLCFIFVFRTRNVLRNFIDFFEEAKKKQLQHNELLLQKNMRTNTHRIWMLLFFFIAATTAATANGSLVC